MIFYYLVTFICLWWIIFFMALPFGSKITKKPEIGHADSAPTKTYLGIKFLITSLIAIIFTFIVMHLIKKGIFIRFIEEYFNFLAK